MDRFKIYVQLCAFLVSASAFAYTPVGHEQITKAALHYLGGLDNDASHWLVRDPESARKIERALTHAAVEPDYVPDMWGKVLGYGPVTGMKNGASIAAFSSLFHFMNVTRPGRYWDYDGFAYRDRHGRKTDRERNPSAIEHARQQILAQIVGPERVIP